MDTMRTAEVNTNGVNVKVRATAMQWFILTLIVVNLFWTWQNAKAMDNLQTAFVNHVQYAAK